MFKFRGLYALILLLSLTSILNAKYLYKDDVVKNPDFAHEIERVGSELFEKTGVQLYLVLAKDLPSEYNSTVEYEKSLLKNFKEPVVLLTFVEFQNSVDIIARPTSLYKDFDKKQVLSPYMSLATKLVSALLFARSIDQADDIISTPNGNMIPVLAEREKGENIISKYSVGMYQGYTDIADGIAKTHNVTLSSTPESGSRDFIDLFKILFYAIVLYAIVRYIMVTRKRKRILDEEGK